MYILTHKKSLKEQKCWQCWQRDRLTAVSVVADKQKAVVAGASSGGNGLVVASLLETSLSIPYRAALVNRGSIIIEFAVHADIVKSVYLLSPLPPLLPEQTKPILLVSNKP